MNYIGKICPYCRTPFEEDDEVVVCSVCNMPHHKECWLENKSCSTFGCRGTIKSIDEDENKSEELFCYNCGNKLSQNAKFCPNCGAKIIENYTINSDANNINNYNNYNNYSNIINNIEKELISNNIEYYENKFNDFKIDTKITSWNWAAFWFGTYWYIYRKMYLEAIAYLFISYILRCIPNIGWILVLILSVINGIYGNIIYFKHIKSIENEIKDYDYANVKFQIKKKGGTSYIGIIILIVLLSVLEVLIKQ